MAATASFTSIDYSVIAICLVAAILLYIRRTSKFPLPPGPRRLPLVGSYFDAPSDHEWITYGKWGKQFGSDILYYEVFGAPIVVINTLEVAHDLFVKRGTIYSDRPLQPMLNDLTGFSWHFAFMGYNDSWKERRKLFHRELVSPVRFPRQDKEIHAARVLLRRLLEKPEDRSKHLRFLAASTIMSIGYGIDVNREDDQFVGIAQIAMEGMAATGIAGSFLVDYLPALRHIPEWFPGAGFKQMAKGWRKYVLTMVNMPFASVKSAIMDGTTLEDSIAKRLLEQLHENNLTYLEFTKRETVIKEMLGALYAAGSDTTVISLETFFLAMVLHPDIQKQAQAHVDAIIDPTKEGRLPDFSDSDENGTDSPPYLQALLREVLRWQPLTPLELLSGSALHVGRRFYGGYRIPKGAIVLGNAWSMLRDEKIYPEPHIFNPNRWLIDGQLNPDLPEPDAAFGFGRRICPGKDLAMSTTWITIVSILATFNIEAVDDCGIKMGESADSLYVPGMLRHPKAFKCSIKPRSKEVENLIKTQAFV